MSKDETVDGPRIAAEILNKISGPQKERLLAAIQQKNPHIATKIQESLIRFDDILNVTATGLQVLLQSIQHQDLILSLKTASEETKTVLLQNLSDRRRTQVLEEFKLLPPTKIQEVEDAQRRILDKLSELRTSGMIRTKGTDDLYV